MSRLIAVELQRVALRRAIRGLVVLGAALIVLVALVAAVNTSGASSDAVPGDIWPAPGFGGDGQTLLAALFFMLAGAAIGGATLVGAEWEQRTIEQTLLWEPRRERVLGAKLAAAAIGAFAASLALSVFLVLAVLVVAGDGTATAGWFVHIVPALVRMGILAALAAILAGSAASIGRRASIGVAVALLWPTLGESIARGFSPSWHRWTLSTNLYDAMRAGDLSGTAHTGRAWLVVVAYVGAAAALAFWDFERRDITGGA